MRETRSGEEESVRADQRALREDQQQVSKLCLFLFYSLALKKNSKDLLLSFVIFFIECLIFFCLYFVFGFFFSVTNINFHSIFFIMQTGTRF